MLICMRTTLNLDADLVREAKKLAADRDTTLTALIEESLRAKLVSHRPRKPIQLTTVGGGWVRAGIDFDNNALLRNIVDGLVDPTRR
jgi:hypothetical protein